MAFLCISITHFNFSVKFNLLQPFQMRYFLFLITILKIKSEIFTNISNLIAMLLSLFS
jgi:hypothetical protein